MVRQPYDLYQTLFLRILGKGNTQQQAISLLFLVVIRCATMR